MSENDPYSQRKKDENHEISGITEIPDIPDEMKPTSKVSRNPNKQPIVEDDDEKIE